MLKKFLFADLDDTLFQTFEKCAALDSADALEPAAYYKDGSICSYTTRAQRAFLSFVQDGMTVIPTTARDQDGLRRVHLPFDSYAIINYGGVVLHPDGSADRPWLEGMRSAMHAALPGLQELARHIDEHAARTGYGGRARMIEDFATPLFLVVKDPDKIHARLEPLEREVVRPWIEDGHPDYVVHRNGNNLAILPKALDKANAVACVTALLRAEHGDIVTFGMGDSRSDARFMAACDYAIVPRATQLAGITVGAL
jgi:hydroxymethylpyrimidine pyrophosphatase-like HAD family hydrolase